MFTNWLLSALATGCGAFFGAIGAYYLAWRKDKERQKNEYLCLLLLVYAHLESLYKLLSALPADTIREADGVKVVEFDIPLPIFPISAEQMQTLMEVAPDKQMPAALIKLQHFLQSHSHRVSKSGAIVLPLAFVQRQVNQLRFMLLSVRVQYEQTANAVAFPLDESAHK